MVQPKPATVVAAWFILCAATVTAQQPPAVYDVTIAGLQHFRNADIARMTPATVTRRIDGDTFVGWSLRTLPRRRVIS